MSLANRVLLSDSALGKRILIPVIGISILALMILGFVMIKFNVDSIQSAMDSKIDFAANFLQQSSSSYAANYDLTALENFVRETEKDRDIAYTVFLDPQGKPLTKGTKEAIREEGGGIFSVSRELKAPDGKALGTVRVFYNQDRVHNARKLIFWIVLASVFFVESVLIAALLAIVRSVNSPMRSIIDRLQEASVTIAATSDELSSSSESLSKGVTKQASAVQETVASMEEMSSMLAKTASNARSCHDLTVTMSQRTEDGARTLERMVSAMGSIEATNTQLHNMVSIIKDISNKTNVINDIVFKTQLLSLNASIEAARAGQHGRGFAVVAEEVGNLAQMSGNAAKEISNLLEKSLQDVAGIVRVTEERVREGREVSDESLRSFREIANDVEILGKQIQGINDAAREQEQGVKQSSDAMILVDETTHANSNIAKQAQSSSQLLSEQSRRIAQINRAIRKLILGSGGAGERERRENQESQDAMKRFSENESARERPEGGEQPPFPHESTGELSERIARRAESAVITSPFSDGREQEFDASDESFRRRSGGGGAG